MTYPPQQTQDNTAGTGTQETQTTYTSGSITTIEYKKPVDEEEEARKKKKAKGKKIRIFIVFAVLVMLMLIVLSAAMLYIFWPRPQVLELENVMVTNFTDGQGRRHWDVKGDVVNIGDESLDITLIEIEITGAVVKEDVKETLEYATTSHEIKSGSQTKLESDGSASFWLTNALIEEASTTRFDPSVIVKVYYDGDLMDEEKINVGGQW